jgi:hypothetical protein
VALPFKLLTRRAGPVGLALTAYDIWRRLPPKQRKRLLAQARRHGPRLASAAVERTRRTRPRQPKP